MKYEPGARSRVHRIPDRARYEAETVHRIVDEALICHVGISIDDRPFVIPTIHARDGDRLLFHGAKAGRLLKHIQAGNEICVTITLVDGLVLARSVFHHSMNYRSVVLFGTGSIVDDPDEKLRGLHILSEHILPGRWHDARTPSRKELNATTLVSMHIDEASAKIRSGPPSDDDDDRSLPVWAGLIPVTRRFGNPVADDLVPGDLPIPGYVQDYHRVN